jgi:hypothetical protein
VAKYNKYRKTPKMHTRFDRFITRVMYFLADKHIVSLFLEYLLFGGTHSLHKVNKGEPAVFMANFLC